MWKKKSIINICANLAGKYIRTRSNGNNQIQHGNLRKVGQSFLQ